MTTPATAVSARETYQLLKDVALGIRPLVRLEANDEAVVVDIDGWAVTLLTKGQALVYCQSCIAPDGRQGSLDSWQRYGTNPVNLLSTWEQAQLEGLLRI
jgi:hypothetical protein